MATMIEVINWEKYNPRRDYHTHWFRLAGDIFTNPNIPDLEPEEFKVFIFILCTTCQRQGKNWHFDVLRVSKTLGVSTDAVSKCIGKLQQFQIVRFRNGSVPESPGTVPEPVAHNVTVHYEHNVTKRIKKLHTTSACAEACVLWKKLHQSRYNASIPWGAKENGQLSRLTKSVSKEDLILDIEFWFSWNEPFVVKTCHSLGLFIKTHAKVSTARQNPNVLIAERSNQRSYENTMNAMEVFHAPNNSALERRAAIDQQAEGINDDVPESSVLSNGLPSERCSEEDGEFLEYESHSKRDDDSDFS